MAVSASCSEALYQRIDCKNKTQRVTEIIIFFLHLSLITLRLLTLTKHGFPWLLAFLCETWLTFNCFVTLNIRWNPVEYKTFPQNLRRRWTGEEFPAVDMFITTANPVLEPPIMTLNTVLSLLAIDYPSQKLACYVSDDAASVITFFSLVETIEFAKLWVPFCKKYGVSVRAPFRYFITNPDDDEPPCGDAKTTEFHLQHQRMKVEYEKLVQKIQAAIDYPLLLVSNQEFEAFSGIEVNNHATIIKVIWENKGLPDGLPDLVYISREKRPKHSHHYKAGAMNVLTRVSGVMTNAPFMLNVDCDMYANNPQIAMHAMCLLLGLNETDSAFVQSPQYFYSGPNIAMQIFYKYTGRGIVGSGAFFYMGTGCFHRRKVIYGILPGENEPEGRSLVDDKRAPEALRKRFGNSADLIKSVAKILSGAPPGMFIRPTEQLSTLVDSAIEVANCSYEHDTYWGKKVGLMYGSTTEDLLTSMEIHSRGWRSVSCTPEPPAFLGCAPLDTPTILSQQRRWATGMLENLFNNTHRLLWATLNGRLGFHGLLACLWINIAGIRCIVDICYFLLPAYCIITNNYFLPKGLALCVPLGCFVISTVCRISEFIQSGISVRVWWNFKRMDLINSATARLFGVISVVYKLAGLSQPVFEITRKVQVSSESGMTFDDSPIFVPATTLTLVHLVCLAMVVLGLQVPSNGQGGSGIGEVACSVWVVISFWPFVEGLVKKGSNGIPCSTICKSAGLALLFVQFCRPTTWV